MEAEAHYGDANADGTNRTDALSFEGRLGATFTRTLPRLGPEVREQLSAIITPASLAIIAGVLVACIVSHAFGVGIIPEGAALIATGIVAGIRFRLWFKEQVVDRAAAHTSLGKKR
jgi:hypothetical protein